MKSVWNYIKSRLPLFIIFLCVISCAVAGMVFGKYSENQDDQVGIDIVAGGKLTVTVDGGEPESGITDETEYTITNKADSNMTTYVRVAVVINWQDDEGNIWAGEPVEGTDYTVSAPNCTILDGYYYYNGSRKPGDTFIVTVTPTNPKDNRTLDVQILAEGIQNVPEDAVVATWRVEFKDGKWVKAGN